MSWQDMVDFGDWPHHCPRRMAQVFSPPAANAAPPIHSSASIKHLVHVTVVHYVLHRSSSSGELSVVPYSTPSGVQTHHAGVEDISQAAIRVGTLSASVMTSSTTGKRPVQLADLQRASVLQD